jgi:hypothetical protein
MNLAVFSSFRRTPESSGFLGSGFRRNDTGADAPAN